MRNYLKVPGFILVLLIFLPFWLMMKYGHEEWYGWELRVITLVLPNLLLGMWYVAVSDFIKTELKEANSTIFRIIQGLGVLYLVATFYMGSQMFITESLREVAIFSSFIQYANLLLVPISIMLVFEVRKYMYARSLWWLIIELAIPIIGVLTLGGSLLEEKKYRLGQSLVVEDADENA